MNTQRERENVEVCPCGLSPAPVELKQRETDVTAGERIGGDGSRTEFNGGIMDKPNEARAEYELARSAVHDVKHAATPKYGVRQTERALSDGAFGREIVSAKLIIGSRECTPAELMDAARKLNVHDELVKALRDLAPILNSAESNASGMPNFEFVSKRVNAARAALAKAGAA